MVLVSLIQTEALSGGLVEQCLMADILPTDRGDLIAESVHRTVGLAQIVVPVNFLVEGGQLVEYAIGVSRANPSTGYVYWGRCSASIRPGTSLSREPRMTHPRPSE